MTCFRLTDLPAIPFSEIIAVACEWDGIVSLRTGLAMRLVNKDFDREVQHAYFQLDVARLASHQIVIDRLEYSATVRMMKGFISRRNHKGQLSVLHRNLLSGIALLTNDLNEESHLQLESGQTTCAAVSEEPVTERRRDANRRDMAIALICDSMWCLYQHNMISFMMEPGSRSDWDYTMCEGYTSLDQQRKKRVRCDVEPPKLFRVPGIFWTLLATCYLGDIAMVRKCISRFCQIQLPKAETSLECTAAFVIVCAEMDHSEVANLVLDSIGVETFEHTIGNITFDLQNATEAALRANSSQTFHLLRDRGWCDALGRHNYGELLISALWPALMPGWQELPRDIDEDMFAKVLDFRDWWQTPHIIDKILTAAAVGDQVNIARLMRERFVCRSASPPARYALGTWTFDSKPVRGHPITPFIMAIKHGGVKFLDYLLGSRAQLQPHLSPEEARSLRLTAIIDLLRRGNSLEETECAISARSDNASVEIRNSRNRTGSFGSSTSSILHRVVLGSGQRTSAYFEGNAYKILPQVADGTHPCSNPFHGPEPNSLKTQQPPTTTPEPPAGRALAILDILLSHSVDLFSDTQLLRTVVNCAGRASLPQLASVCRHIPLKTQYPSNGDFFALRSMSDVGSEALARAIEACNVANAEFFLLRGCRIRRRCCTLNVSASDHVAMDRQRRIRSLMKGYGATCQYEVGAHTTFLPDPDFSR